MLKSVLKQTKIKSYIKWGHNDPAQCNTYIANYLAKVITS